VSFETIAKKGIAFFLSILLALSFLIAPVHGQERSKTAILKVDGIT
jgi:hypothetical protein